MYLKKAIVPVFISLLLLPSNRIIDTSMVILVSPRASRPLRDSTGPNFEGDSSRLL